MANRKIVLHTDWFDVESEEYEEVPQLNGQPAYRVNVPDSVMIIVLTEGERVILVEQFRPASARRTLEFPAGAIDASETPETAAHRELYEETGYRCGTLKLASRARLAAERLNSTVYVFFGRGAVHDPGFRPEPGIDVTSVSLGELKGWATAGRCEQLTMLGAILLVKLRLAPPELREF